MWPPALLPRFLQLSGVSRALLTSSSSEVLAQNAAISLVNVLREQQQSSLSGVKCLLICSEPELKFVGSPVAALLRKAGFQPFLHPMRPSNIVPEPTAFRDAASVATRTGCSWVLAAGGGEILNFAKGAAATVTNGDNALKGAEKQIITVAAGSGEQPWERFLCKRPSLPLVALSTTWCFDGSSNAHQVWAGPGNSATLHAHPDSALVSLFDSHLTGRLYTGGTALRDVLSLIALAAEAGMHSPSSYMLSPKDAPLVSAASAAAVQQGILLLRRVLERGSRPPTDEERHTDTEFAMRACVATGVLHRNARLGILHALSSCAQQMHRLPYSVTSGAMAPHVLDWLWAQAECEETLERAQEEEEEEDEGDDDDDSGDDEEADQDGDGDGNTNSISSMASAARLQHQEKLERCKRLDGTRALLLSTCKSVLTAPNGSSSAASKGSAALSSSSSFTELWGEMLAGSLAPASSSADLEECREILNPRVRLGGGDNGTAERELLAATAELHDSALRAPLVPSKQDLSNLLKRMLA